MASNSCLTKESMFSDDICSTIFQTYSDQYINNENFNNDNENPPGQIDNVSVSSNSSASNLKIDAPEFIPFQKLKIGDLKGHKTMDCLKDNSETTVISNDNDNKFDADFKNDVLFLLQNILKKLASEFSHLNRKQEDLLFKREDRVNFLQKMFLDEVNKEKQKLEEEKIKNVQLQAKLESLSEILAKTTKEKEEQIKQNVLLKSYLEKQLDVMNNFQKNVLTEYHRRCCYMKMKLQQVAPYITCSVPWYKDFQTNLQAWTSYEILLTKHLASVESNSKLLKIVDYNKLDNLPDYCNFPISEPKSILNDAFLHVIHSYNYLHENKSPFLNYQPNHEPPHYNNNQMCYQQPADTETAPVYYTNAQLSRSNMQNSSACRPNGQYQRSQIPIKNISASQQTFSNGKKMVQNDNCLLEQKTLPIKNLENVSNPEEPIKPNLSLDCELNPNVSQLSNKSCMDLVIPDQELPSPLSPNISQLKKTQSSNLPINHKIIKESLLPLDLIQTDCLETDRATQGTSEAHFDDLDNFSPETDRKKDKNKAMFYDATLGIEEQIENLSANVKAVGGMKFLHLFLYLWQNIPYVTEETLLQALLSVKKTVGKFTGMKKESILISVKRILEPDTENSGIPNVLTEVCTICYENFSTSKTLRLKCGHTFHYSCGNKWLVNNNVCPICRFCILSEDDVQ
ncbi:uncharacterized protein LOC108733594 isoform X2 [Agrilus planipennis]|uniref:Uncharacterized protein LOC108733594 isoform X2 n=1 Tax=Agrilus planipennis TaxID=224129 RepID=A0A1W4WJM0_AGRPL|nr:uncharacterized protein LOC108733594 isoform X2 [Agrilus planipennis]